MLNINDFFRVNNESLLNLAFVGHFSPASQSANQANSTAGNQVQRKIFQECIEQSEIENATCYVMTPHPIWPNGPFICRSVHEGSIDFIGYLNLPVFKHLIFALRLLMRLFISRPQLCLQYNSYVFENLALLLYRCCSHGISLAIIIQDIHTAPGLSLLSRGGLRSYSEHISLRLAKRFDMIVPISVAIISDFDFSPSKCLVFQGGVTDFAIQMMNSQMVQFEEIAVFAGGLEPHNGIDRLVDQWISCGIKRQLHVFGRGSLSAYLLAAALRSDLIIFHGFQSEHVVLAWQLKARWNFCLRFSLGINQTYFFPSKFFNILCAPGVVVVNDFYGLPATVRDHLCVISDDFSDLIVSLSATVDLSNSESVQARRQIVQASHSWSSCVDKIIYTLRPKLIR